MPFNVFNLSKSMAEFATIFNAIVVVHDDLRIVCYVGKSMAENASVLNFMVCDNEIKYLKLYLSLQPFD